MAKKYGLHCFSCGNLLYSKEEVYRRDGKPYCGECLFNSSNSDRDRYEEEQFYKQFPTDQDYIDYKNIQKYGEC